MVELLAPQAAARLRGQQLTYPERGRTAGSLPSGYQHFSKTHTLPPARTFDEAVHDLMSWQVQERSGLRVRASSATVEVDAVTSMRFGIWRAALEIPCRVVYILNEPNRRGFAYGSLPGHPESGEEAFVLHRRGDERIDFSVFGFARPAKLITRMSGPVARQVQSFMTGKYLRSLDR